MSRYYLSLPLPVAVSLSADYLETSHNALLQPLLVDKHCLDTLQRAASIATVRRCSRPSELGDVVGRWQRYLPGNVGAAPTLQPSTFLLSCSGRPQTEVAGSNCLGIHSLSTFRTVSISSILADPPRSSASQHAVAAAAARMGSRTCGPLRTEKHNPEEHNRVAVTLALDRRAKSAAAFPWTSAIGSTLRAGGAADRQRPCGGRDRTGRSQRFRRPQEPPALRSRRTILGGWAPLSCSSSGTSLQAVARTQVARKCTYHERMPPPGAGLLVCWCADRPTRGGRSPGRNGGRPPAPGRAPRVGPRARGNRAFVACHVPGRWPPIGPIY